MMVSLTLKLDPLKGQREQLEATMKAVNAAANWVSERAFSEEEFGQAALQGLLYREVRERFGLGAQAALLLFSKVSAAYRFPRSTAREFREFGSVNYDERSLSLCADLRLASIWTLSGRKKVPFLCGEFPFSVLKLGMLRGADLVRRRDGALFLLVAILLPDEAEDCVWRAPS